MASRLKAVTASRADLEKEIAERRHAEQALRESEEKYRELVEGANSIILRSDRDGNSYYRVAIEDNGNGIPDERKEEVFHRFKRGQTRARGTGLGLYLVRSLVEGFGGHVEVQSRGPRGLFKGHPVFSVSARAGE